MVVAVVGVELKKAKSVYYRPKHSLQVRVDVCVGRAGILLRMLCFVCSPRCNMHGRSVARFVLEHY